MKLNMAVFERDDPWEATFYLGKFFGNGGVCRLHDDFNWVGAAFICSSKANNILSAKVEMVQRLAWAFLAILINESFAKPTIARGRNHPIKSAFALFSGEDALLLWGMEDCSTGGGNAATHLVATHLQRHGNAKPQSFYRSQYWQIAVNLGY